MAHALGKPSLFITLTCNPHWREITAALEPGQTWEDRADVVNRVFQLKLRAFVQDVREGTFFKDKNGAPWKAKYIMYVVEFQKRGKPHAHITMRLAGTEEDMPKSAEAVDALIWARIPEVDKCDCSFGAGLIGPPLPPPPGFALAPAVMCEQHRLKDSVQRHMMHRCISGVCLDKEGPRVCKRNFPKAVCGETTQDDGGFPVYRRAAGDEYVVSYNPIMLLKYDCHINVEICTNQWVHRYMVSVPHCEVPNARPHSFLSLPTPPSP